MRLVTRSLVALGALAAGFAGAVAFASDDPIAPKSLAVYASGAGVGTSYDGVHWTDFPAGVEWDLPLLNSTYVRGPAIIYVVAGTSIQIPAGSTVVAVWQPAIRGWQFTANRGGFEAQFAITHISVVQGRSLTLTLPGELYREPTAYGAKPVISIPEVSSFLAFE